MNDVEILPVVHSSARLDDVCGEWRANLVVASVQLLEAFGAAYIVVLQQLLACQSCDFSKTQVEYSI